MEIYYCDAHKGQSRFRLLPVPLTACINSIIYFSKPQFSPLSKEETSDNLSVRFRWDMACDMLSTYTVSAQ